MSDGHVVKHPLTQPSPPRGRGLIRSSRGLGEGLVSLSPYNQPFLRNHQSGTTAETTIMIRAIG
ncbi:MAG: hypothetical protein RJA87_27 [Pseudomonadota bacterium]|jgi:hypothetical protein